MPSIQSFYPNTGSTGIPIGASIVVIFDGAIDEESFKSNFFLFGPDNDILTTPFNSMLVDSYGRPGRSVLDTPGLTGRVECDFTFTRLASDNSEEETPDYSNANTPIYRTKVIITPKVALAPSTTYTTMLIGDTDSSRGVSDKTVFDVEKTNVVGTSGLVVARGTYTGTSNRYVIIRVTAAGDSRNADFIFYYEDAPLIIGSGTTSRKWRPLSNSNNGIEIKWSGTDLQVDDTFRFEVKPPVLLTSNYSTTFTTGTGSIESVPEAASTSILGDLNNDPATSEFEVVRTTPADETVKVDPSTKIIEVLFSLEVDPLTVTDKNVRITIEPTTGYDPSTAPIVKPNRFLFVDGDKLYIILQASQ